ncbi:uncharacterized protein CANTADRAFT_29562, partial [Suhomyces tanzawaensis NRRL Y-17324]
EDEIRRLSLLLFAEVKPKCVELSTLTMSPNFTKSPQLVSTLGSISQTLQSHKKDNTLVERPYILSKNLADYIFFPLTALLKQTNLDDAVIQHVLNIIGFLTRFSWSSDVNLELIDQLYPLVVVLSGITSMDSLGNKSLELRSSTIYCLSSIISAIPSTYFNDTTKPKRLQFLGNSITILLTVITSLINPTSQEQSSLVEESLESLDLLITDKATAELISHVLPGIVSQIVNFVVSSRNLHFSLHLLILELLRHLIVKVFSDSNLGVESENVETEFNTLMEVNKLWESGNLEQEMLNGNASQIAINIPESTKHRTMSWLKATSKQLKLSLNVLFKNLLLSSQVNKAKFRSKPKMGEKVISFIVQICENCFLTLFNEVVPLGLDVLSALISCTTIDDPLVEATAIAECSKLIIDALKQSKSPSKHGTMLFNLVRLKLEDLIDSKMTTALFSTDEEKINAFLVSMKIQLQILSELSEVTFIGSGDLSSMSSRALKRLKASIIECHHFSTNKSLSKSESFKFRDSTDEESKDNMLDNIELPPSINAKYITKINPQGNGSQSTDGTYSSNMMILSNKFDNIRNLIKQNDGFENAGVLAKTYTSKVESKLQSFVRFLGSSTKVDLTVDFLDEFFDQDPTNYFEQIDFLGKARSHFELSISLWIANNMLANSKIELNHNREIDEFLISDELDHLDVQVDSHSEEVCYFIMSKSQDQINEISEIMSLNKYLRDEIHLYETSYAIALDSIGTLSNCLPFEDFQADYLIEYLYPLLESLTYQSNPLIQSHGQNAVKMIIDNYYNGSLEALILDNLDYLIDSMNIRLSVITNLTPTLPKLLLLVMKIAGMKLLERNELNEILTQMFILIDSYHGYSMIVEGFFIVFEELINQIKKEYLVGSATNLKAQPIGDNSSSFKPWGMTNKEQLMKLIGDAEILAGTTEYDLNKEYFVRQEGVPFGDQIEETPDSDDEEYDSDENGSSEKDEKKWTSSVPKTTYLLVQRIFKYGFMMLTHQSQSVKIQILRAMKQAYPVLSTDHSLLIPIVTENWPVLFTLISGTNSLTTFQETQTSNSDSQNLVLPALEFAQVILDEDEALSERFMGRRFVESWEFLVSHNQLLKEVAQESQSIGQNSSSEVTVPKSKALARSRIDPRISAGYVKYLWTGLKAYNKVIPDTTRYNMVRFAYALGIPPQLEQPQEVKNTAWIIKLENGN